MATPVEPRQARRPRIGIVHAGAIAGVVLTGALALVAFVVGSPLQFGVALALCGVGWIAADFTGGPARRRPARGAASARRGCGRAGGHSNVSNVCAISRTGETGLRRANGRGHHDPATGHIVARGDLTAAA